MGSKATGELTEEQQIDIELKKAFRLFDKHDKGYITSDDVSEAMRSLGQNPTEDELKGLIAELDRCGPAGAIGFSKFKNFMIPRMKDADSEEQLEETFNIYDKDKDGFISAAEFREVMTSLGDAMTDEEANGSIAFADLDGDGKVSFKEFVNMMRDWPRPS